MFNNWLSRIRLPDWRSTQLRAAQVTLCRYAMVGAALSLPVSLLPGEERRPSVAPWAPSARKEGQFESDFLLPGINNRQGLPANSSADQDSPSTLPNKSKPSVPSAPDNGVAGSGAQAKGDIPRAPSKDLLEAKSGNNSMASKTATEDTQVRPAPRLKPVLRVPMGPTVELAEPPRLLPIADAPPPAAKSSTSQALTANSKTANTGTAGTETPTVKLPAHSTLPPVPATPPVGNGLTNHLPTTVPSAGGTSPPPRPRDLAPTTLPLAAVPPSAIPFSQSPAATVVPPAGSLVQRPQSGGSQAASPTQSGNATVVTPVPESRASSHSASSQPSARSAIVELPASRQAPPSGPPPRLASSAVVEVVATPLANPARPDKGSDLSTGPSTPSPLAPPRQAVVQNSGAQPTQPQPKSALQSAPSATPLLPHVAPAFQTATTAGGPPAVQHAVEQQPAFLGSPSQTAADNSSRSNRVASPATAVRPDSVNLRGQPAAGTQLTAAHFETPAEKSANLKLPRAETNPERQAAAGELRGQAAAQADDINRAPRLSAQSPFVASQEAGTIRVVLERPLLLHTQADIYRAMVVDPTIGEVVRITTKDVSITGRTRGKTHVTFFFEDEKQPQLTYLLEVTSEPTNK